MHELRSGLATFLLFNILVGLIRIARGPTLADRILVAQLYGTTAVAVLLLLGADAGASAIHDVALVFALFSGVSLLAYVRMASPPGASDERP